MLVLAPFTATFPNLDTCIFVTFSIAANFIFFVSEPQLNLAVLTTYSQVDLTMCNQADSTMFSQVDLITSSRADLTT